MSLTQQEIQAIAAEAINQRNASNADTLGQARAAEASARAGAQPAETASLIAAAAKAGAEAAIAALRSQGGAAAGAPPLQQTQELIAQRAPYQRRPVSDGGGSAAPPRNLDGVSLFTMSEADRAHLIKEKGLDWYRKTLAAQSRDVGVKLR